MSKHTRTRLPEGTTQVRNASTGEVKQVSDIKMSEVFDLPLTDNFGCIQEVDGRFIADLESNEMDEAAVLAINSHDKLTSRVAELEAALSELMDKASECDSWESFPEQYLEDARNALKDSEL